MSNFENLGTGFEQLNNDTLDKQQGLENLDNAFQKKDISFSDKNAKVMIAAGALVSGKVSNFESNKSKIEKELARGGNPESVLRNNENGLNIDTKEISADSLKGSEGMGKMIKALGQGDCFIYQNSNGDLRVVYGATVEKVNVDGRDSLRASFSAYSGDGFVGDKTIRSEIGDLMSKGGTLTYATEAKSMTQELVRPYDNSMSR